jgi:hypothetical protein
VINKAQWPKPLLEALPYTFLMSTQWLEPYLRLYPTLSSCHHDGANGHGCLTSLLEGVMRVMIFHLGGKENRKKDGF